ncbi:MAG: Sjogren's syndrome/scleroderma autoantigen 1 family protein [Thermoproteota archaeon]
MSNDLTKRAAEMLLKGATLLAEPCPYCKGVRIMKDGNAFCVSCGREPEPEVEIDAEKKSESQEKSTVSSQSDSTLITLAKKLESLSKELEKETDYEKQQQILKSINSLVEIIAKLRS